MLTLIIRRLLIIFPLLVLVSMLTFLLLELVPGDPAQRLLGGQGTPEQVEQIRSELGLTDPLPVRYWDFAGNALRGDLGDSLYNHRPVTTRIADALPATLWLAAVALAFVLIAAIPAGVIAAMRPDSVLDRGLTVASSLAMSVPQFVVAILLISVFAIQNPWLPALGYASPSEGLVEWSRHLILPGIALSVLPGAELARQIRGAMRDTLESDYVVAARAKGLRSAQVVIKHAAKNAAIPVVTIFGLLINRVISGAVVVEAVFNFPGLGSLAVQSTFARDLPVIQGIILVSAITVILANLLVDVSYGYFNPRLRR